MIELQKPIQILLLGDKRVGKTSLIDRYVKDQFQEQYLSTIQIKSSMKRVTFKKKQLVIQISDTMGMNSERDAKLIEKNIENSDGILVLFDLMRRKTKEKARYWIRQIYKMKQFRTHLIVMLVATKFEQNPLEQISQDQIVQFSKQCSTECVVCSSKTTFNVEQIFVLMTAKILKFRENVKKKEKQKQCIIY